MKIEQKNGVAVIRASGVLISSPQEALDLIATVNYETGCTALVLPKAAVSEDFFRLATGFAGEVLQKFSNYQMRLALVGDFSAYPSKPLQDFIRESNQGKSVFFLADEAEAVARLSR